MPLHYRKRGESWHARGRICAGTKTVTVAEFSTGARARADAEAIGAAYEADIRGDILDGPPGRLRRLTIGDCLESYLARPGGVKAYDVARISAFNELIGGHRLANIAQQAWRTWMATHGAHQKPSTTARLRAVLQAALNHGCAEHDVPPPRLPGIKGGAGAVRAATCPMTSGAICWPATIPTPRRRCCPGLSGYAHAGGSPARLALGRFQPRHAEPAHR